MTDRRTIDTINSDQLDQLYDERDRLRAAILDIDAHATLIGQADPNDPDGNPHHYAVTVGALHRALGKVGHTAAPCTAEAAIERVRALADRWDNALAPDLAYARALRAALDAPGPAATEATEATDTEKTTRVFAALHRSAEQDVTRVIALYDRWVKAGPAPLGASLARWWDARLTELHTALAEPAPDPAATDTEEQP